MDVRNCKKCGRIFNYYGGQPFCPTCMEKLEVVFKQVKEYIYENPQAGVQEIVEQFEVSVPIVHQWIREERLCFAPDAPVGIGCEGCGITIKTGRYCVKCKEALLHGFSGALRKDEPIGKKTSTTKENPKMRFFS